MPVSLKSQVVLVVGASSGIGRETTILFAREGARVVASARRGDRLRSLQDQLAKKGFQLDISPADASSAAEMEQLAQRTRAQFGSIDIVVFAAGTNTPDRAMKHLNPQIWDMMLNVNLSSAYYVTQAVLPSMREVKAGHLIYI